MAKCKCCKGEGTQLRKDGIYIHCPACGGTGEYVYPPLKWARKGNWEKPEPDDVSG